MNKTILSVAALAVVAAAGFGVYAMQSGPSDAAVPVAATSPAADAARPAPISERPATPVSSEANGELMQPGPLGDVAIGAADAPVTIIEYASLTCVHCGNFHNGAYKALKEKYIDTGKVRFIFREFPLDNFATAGFVLARCGDDSRYFPIIDAFFANQKDMFGAQDPLAWLTAFARQVGFSQQEMEACLENQELIDGVSAVRQRASQQFGVESTPTFFINGQIRRGAMTEEELDEALAPLLPS